MALAGQLTVQENEINEANSNSVTVHAHIILKKAQIIFQEARSEITDRDTM